MHTWQPNPSLFSFDLQTLVNHTTGALLLEVQKREPARESEALDCFAARVAALGPDLLGLLHPYVFRFYNDYREQDDNSLSVECLFSNILPAVQRSRERARSNAAGIGLAIDTNAYELAGEGNLRRLNHMANIAAGYDHPLFIRTEPLSAAQHNIVSDAAMVLGRVWPEMHAEVEGGVACLGFLEGEATIGAADFSCNGAVFLNINRLTDPVKVAEEVVHEASHVRLNTAMASEPFVLNGPEERFHSPLRRDVRPMFGLLHQAFVLGRLREFYRRCALELDPKYQRDVSNIDKLLDDCLPTLERHGRFTTHGAQLVSSLTEDFGVAA